MQISLITCVYNNAKYLKRCFDSIIKQKYTDFEVVVIDDGSTDNSQEIINKYIEIDQRFRFVLQNHAGQAVARNRGITEAKGNYIVFVDSDDEINDNYLLFLSGAIDKNVDLGYSKITRIYDDKPNYLVKNFNYIDAYDAYITNIKDNKEAITKISNSPCAKIFRKKFIVDNNIMFYPNRLYEDFLFNSSFLLCNPSVMFIDDDSYIYHVHTGTSMTGNGNRVFEIFEVFDAIVEFANERKVYDYYHDELEYLAFYHIAIGTMYRSFCYKPFSFFSSLKKCRNFLKKYNYKNSNKYISDISLFERVYLKVFFTI